MRVLAALACLTVLFAPLRAGADATEQTAPVVDAKMEEARSHFDLGLFHFDRAEYGAALAEFLRAREIFPTRTATKNAAICLTKEGRADEAMDMFEALIRDFPNTSASDLALARLELDELGKRVGTLAVTAAERGASITIDARYRATAPAGPLRLAAGDHIVRVYADGFTPFEQHVEIASGQTRTIQAHLFALARSGQLRVVETGGKALDVVVDNAVVGRTGALPWTGALAVGDHTVVLHGEGASGTQPVSASVRPNELTVLSLAAEDLRATARVVPTPAGASVAIDGVLLGHGIWEGRLRAGAHRMEAVAEGFVPVVRNVQLPVDARTVVSLELERDATAPLWSRPPRFTLEGDIAGAWGPLFGGDVEGACDAACARGVALGALAKFHGGYELQSGLGMALDVGYLALWKSIRQRATFIVPEGLPSNAGVANDDLRLSGLLLGASGAFHRGTAFPVTFRLGAGVLLGSVRDARSGTFTNGSGSTYTAAVTDSAPASYVYFSPEARIGVRLGAGLELNAGVEANFLVALKQPSWTGTPVLTSSRAGDRGDGLGRFQEGSLTGTLMILISPALAVRYEL